MNDPRKITPKELEVARLRADGLTIPQIANRLKKSAKTVASQLDRIKLRLRVETTAELVAVIRVLERTKVK